MRTPGLPNKQAEAELAAAGEAPPLPPVALRDEELRIWFDLVGLRNPAWWQPGRLRLLLTATRALARVQDCDKRMARDDFEPVLVGSGGGSYLNPLTGYRTQSLNSALAAMRGLGLTVSPNAAQAAGNAAARTAEAKDTFQNNHDDLIPGLSGPAWFLTSDPTGDKRWQHPPPIKQALGVAEH